MSKQCLTALVLAVLLGAGFASAWSHHRSNRSSDAPGNFDYYLLTLSWAPDFCASPNANTNSRECGSGNHVGFVVHGLWPQFNNGGYPKECAPASPVSSAIVNQMLPYIPAAGLIQHEWKEHGTCSGLDATTYFGDIRQAFHSVKIPADYQNLGQKIGVNPVVVESKFAAANPSFPKDAFRVGCGGGQMLADVRICFSKRISAQSCPATERDCSAGSVTMLPER